MEEIKSNNLKYQEEHQQLRGLHLHVVVLEVEKHGLLVMGAEAGRLQFNCRVVQGVAFN